jgi:hypothetical protein
VFGIGCDSFFKLLLCLGAKPVFPAPQAEFVVPFGIVFIKRIRFFLISIFRQLSLLDPLDIVPVDGNFAVLCLYGYSIFILVDNLADNLTTVASVDHIGLCDCVQE